MFMLILWANDLQTLGITMDGASPDSVPQQANPSRLSPEHIQKMEVLAKRVYQLEHNKEPQQPLITQTESGTIVVDDAVKALIERKDGVFSTPRLGTHRVFKSVRPDRFSEPSAVETPVPSADVVHLEHEKVEPFLRPTQRKLAHLPVKNPENGRLPEALATAQVEQRQAEGLKLKEAERKYASTKLARIVDKALKAEPFSVITTLPPVVDLTGYIPWTFDQGMAGTCTANALCWIRAYKDKQYLGVDTVPSRLFNYYFSRLLSKPPVDPDVPQPDPTMVDSGVPLTDAIKGMQLKGSVPEKLWPYSDEKISPYYERAPFQVNPLSKLRTAVNDDLYEASVDSLCKENIDFIPLPHDINLVKRELAKKNPLYLGIWCTDGFLSDQTAKTGYMPTPWAGENVHGGHAMVLAGYDDTKQSWIVKNSWGTKWGAGGKCYMPYDFLMNPSWGADIIKIKFKGLKLVTTQIETE